MPEDYILKLCDLFPLGRFSLPAKEDSIAAVETQLQRQFPEQLRRLYVECDGFREDRGNAKYLLSLMDEDVIGSVVSVSKFMWSRDNEPDLRPFIFFGFSGGDEAWGINAETQDEIVSYHHHMGEKYAVVGSDIIQVFLEDYTLYDEVDKGA